MCSLGWKMGERSERMKLIWKDRRGRTRKEIAVYRWRVLGPKDIIILGLINLQDGVRWTTDIRHFLDSCLSHLLTIISVSYAMQIIQAAWLRWCSPLTLSRSSTPPLSPVMHFNLPLSWCSTSKTDPENHLISMQQYANGLDLLVSVCFISPGFFLSLCHAVALSLPLSYFSLLATSTHADKLSELIYCRVHVFPCICVFVSADMCAILIPSHWGPNV